MFDPGIISAYERQALREIFYGGKHHGALVVNWNESIGDKEY
jgi:hypothetical protein